MCTQLMFMLQLPDFILKNYGESKGITKADIWYIAEKRCAAVLRATPLCMHWFAIHLQHFI